METLKLMNKIRKYTHPSIKIMRFYASDVASLSDPKEILEYMFNKSYNFKSSTVKNFEEMCNSMMLNPNMIDIQNNPFGFIDSFMSGSDYPFKAFMDYLDYTKKTMKFVKVQMITDFFCTGNMDENLLNLYKTKSDPRFVLEDYRMVDKSSDLSFLSMISLGLPITEKKEKQYVKAKDNAVTMSKKLMLSCNNEWALSEEVEMEKIKYKEITNKKEKTRIKIWTDIKMVCISQENLNTKKTLYKIFCGEDVDRNPEPYQMMRSVISRSISEMENLGFEVGIHSGPSTVRSEFFQMPISINQILFKTSVDMKSLKWTMFLHLKIKNIAQKELELPKISLMSDNYTVSNKLLESTEFSEGRNLFDFFYNNTSMIELNDKLEELKWIENDILPAKEEVTTVYKNEVKNDINNTFGLTAMTNVFSSLLGFFKDDENKSYQYDYMNEEDVMLLNKKSGMDKGMLKAMIQNFQAKGEREQEAKEIDPSERISIINLLDKILTTRMEEEVIIDSKKLISFYQMCKKKDKMQIFVQAVMNQIWDMYEGNICESLLLMLVNIVIKKNINLVKVNLNNMTLYKPDTFQIRISDSSKFLNRKVNLEDEYEEMFNELEEERQDELGYMKDEDVDFSVNNPQWSTLF
jgi:hypothetical protein